MHLETTEEIAGIPALRVRDLLRKHRGYFFWNVASAREFLNVSETRAELLMQHLLAGGLVEFAPGWEGEPRMQNTP